MKTTPVCSILACLMTAATSISVAVGEGKPSDGPGGDAASSRDREGASMWQKIDSDGDGSISAEEFGQMPRVQKLPADKRQALFQRLDKDGNGQIDRGEIQHGGKPRDPRDAMPRIWELDKNKDGGVSFEEFQAGPLFQKLEAEKQQKIFSRLDSNQDGKITPEDKPQRRPHDKPSDRPSDEPRRDGDDKRMHPREFLKQLDSDQSGGVSWEEFSASPHLSKVPDEMKRKRFDLTDRNSDGVIDKNDFPARDDAQPEKKRPPFPK